MKRALENNDGNGSAKQVPLTLTDSTLKGLKQSPYFCRKNVIRDISGLTKLRKFDYLSE